MSTYLSNQKNQKKAAETIKAEAIAKKEVSVEKKETSPEVKDEKSTKEKK